MAQTKHFDTTIEGFLPGVKIVNGLNCNLPVYFDNTLEVNGAATFDTTVTHTGAATFTSTVDVGGALTANSTITATGAISTVSTVTALNATALSGAGTQGIGLSNVANFGIYVGSGIPAVTAATGSLYINYGGTGVASRLYVNSGSTSWVAVTTVS